MRRVMVVRLYLAKSTPEFPRRAPRMRSTIPAASGPSAVAGALPLPRMLEKLRAPDVTGGRA